MLVITVLIASVPFTLTLWFVIYLIYRRINTTQHDIHILITRNSGPYNIHFEIYRSQTSTWNSQPWN